MTFINYLHSGEGKMLPNTFIFRFKKSICSTKLGSIFIRLLVILLPTSEKAVLKERILHKYPNIYVQLKPKLETLFHVISTTQEGLFLCLLHLFQDIYQFL